MVAWQKDRRTKYLYNRFSYITISRLLLYIIRYANKIFYNHHHRGKYFIIYFCLIWLLHIFSLIKWIQIFWLFWLTSRFYSKQKKNSLNIFTYLVLKVLTWGGFLKKLFKNCLDKIGYGRHKFGAKFRSWRFF